MTKKSKAKTKIKVSEELVSFVTPQVRLTDVRNFVDTCIGNDQQRTPKSMREFLKAIEPLGIDGFSDGVRALLAAGVEAAYQKGYEDGCYNCSSDVEYYD